VTYRRRTTAQAVADADKARAWIAEHLAERDHLCPMNLKSPRCFVDFWPCVERSDDEADGRADHRQADLRAGQAAAQG